MATEPLLGAWSDHGGMQDVTFRSRYQRIERPAGRQHQFRSAHKGIDPGSIEAHDRSFVRPVAKRLAVASRDIDLVADPNVAQKTEMGIAVRGIDRHAAFAGIGRQLEMARAEGERLAAR